MRHRPLFLLTTLLLTACCGLFARTALADPIHIFSTGVDSSGNPLAAGATDTHYTIIAGPITGSPLVPVITPAPWTASGAGQWLSVFANANQGAPGGDYTFRTAFDLTGYDPSTAALSISLTADNDVHVYLNGNDTGITFNNFVSFSTPFSVLSGFINGINTIDFVVNNAGNTPSPVGLRVGIQGTVSQTGSPAAVPEPASLLLLSTGLAASAIAARRRQQVK